MTPPLWFANLLAYCLQVSVLGLAGTLLPALFRLRLPRVLLMYWQALLVVCLSLPVLQPWRDVAPRVSAGGATVSLVFGAVPGLKTGLRLPVYEGLSALLLLGVLLRLGWLGLGIRRLRVIRRAARPLNSLPGPVAEMRAQLGVAPVLYLSSAVDAPATFGFRPAAVLLPERFAEMDESYQRAILCHEFLHAARRDWSFNLIEEIILAVFWFHPVVMWLVNRIRLSREQVVDAEVVRLTAARKPYLNALLEMASSGAAPACGAAPPFLKECQVRSRIELLLREVTMSKLRLTVSLSGTIVLLVFIGAAGVWAFPLKSPAKRQSLQLLAANPGLGSNPDDAVAGAEKEHAHSSTKGVTPPAAVFKPEPQYTPEAKAAKIQGTVKLRITVDKSGNVSAVKVLEGLDKGLDENAVKTVRTWKFKPAVKDGKPVAANATVEIAFELF